SGFTRYKAGTLVEESDALKLLRILWQDIVKLPKTDVERILRGPRLIQSRSGRIVQTLKLKDLVSKHVDILLEEAEKIRREGGEGAVKLIKEPVSKHIVELHVKTQSLIKQENTIDEDQALELQKLISKYIVKIHGRTDNILRLNRSDEDIFQLLLSCIVTTTIC
ncbi:hypothetical protein Tco_0740734, partial [Tanacetum coccineum]